MKVNVPERGTVDESEVSDAPAIYKARSLSKVLHRNKHYIIDARGYVLRLSLCDIQFQNIQSDYLFKQIHAHINAQTLDNLAHWQQICGTDNLRALITPCLSHSM